MIVWDDGSADRRVVELLEKFASSDPRVKVVVSEHLGRFPSLKAAFAEATGDYLCFVDSDDRLAPLCLQETAEALDTHPEVGWVYTEYRVTNDRNEDLGMGSRCKIPYSPERLLVDFMTFHFRLMRRDAFERAGGIDDQWQYAGDYDLCLRLSETSPVLKVASPLYYYRIHDNTISSRNRIDQILTSAKIIEQALERRGMSKDWELRVEIVGKYRLRRKQMRKPGK